ncbi:MAG: YtxH domain-containing protein [Acidimicrobiia bacterium]|nr:YtxH domain-containing protein [Acidimicrobiia bacterium]
MKKLLFAMVIGAALAFLFDPETGARRREDLKRRLAEKGLISSSDASSATGAVDYSASAYRPSSVSG